MQAAAELLECLVHADHGAAHFESRIMFGLGVGNHLIDALAKPFQCLASGRDVNIDDASDLIMVHLRRRVDHLYVGHGAERRVARVDRPGASKQRHVGRACAHVGRGCSQAGACHAVEYSRSPPSTCG